MRPGVWLVVMGGVCCNERGPSGELCLSWIGGNEMGCNLTEVAWVILFCRDVDAVTLGAKAQFSFPWKCWPLCLIL
jgi:hypothetical protein